MKLKVVFIDEVSMVGYKLFKKIEKQLRDIMGSSTPFGNLHVIVIGDFYQLPAVEDTPLYKIPKKAMTLLHHTCLKIISKYIHSLK